MSIEWAATPARTHGQREGELEATQHEEAEIVGTQSRDPTLGLVEKAKRLPGLREVTSCEGFSHQQSVLYVKKLSQVTRPWTCPDWSEPGNSSCSSRECCSRNRERRFSQQEGVGGQSGPLLSR